MNAIDFINPATKLVIPRQRHRETQNGHAITGFPLPDQVRHRPRGNDGMMDIRWSI
jgi:hypothetical protein